MTQIFVFGSSSAYGVGGPDGGWVDMLKRHLHKTMYDTHGTGETTEVYNFAQPGATIEFVRDSFKDILNTYRQDETTIILLSIGVNNAKSLDTAEGYVTSESDYTALMSDLLDQLTQAKPDHLVVLGYQPCDETKLLPKHNPQTGHSTFFRNARILLFDRILNGLCADKGITYAKVAMSDADWIAQCVYKDGLHPNDRGHRAYFQTILPYIESAS